MATFDFANESISQWISSTEMLTLDSSEASEVAGASFNTTFSSNSTLNHNQQSWITIAIIPLYSVIFLLAVIGNSLVILTLVQNKRMRTITNLFLLNLAASDLFLGVFCMPFTLLGMLLRDFIFGEFMCKMLPYLQGSYRKKEWDNCWARSEWKLGDEWENILFSEEGSVVEQKSEHKYSR